MTDKPEIEKQPVPEVTCPFCGGEATEESVREHKLSNLGYLHDDIVMDCSECEETWTHGVPVGDNWSELAEKLYCDACEDRFQRIHRVDVARAPEEITLHLKCPACYYFKTVDRPVDKSNIVLMGYPDITGSFDDAEPWAYEEDEV